MNAIFKQELANVSKSPNWPCSSFGATSFQLISHQCFGKLALFLNIWTTGFPFVHLCHREDAEFSATFGFMWTNLEITGILSKQQIQAHNNRHLRQKLYTAPKMTTLWTQPLLMLSMEELSFIWWEMGLNRREYLLSAWCGPLPHSALSQSVGLQDAGHQSCCCCWNYWCCVRPPQMPHSHVPPPCSEICAITRSRAPPALTDCVGVRGV